MGNRSSSPKVPPKEKPGCFASTTTIDGTDLTIYGQLLPSQRRGVLGIGKLSTSGEHLFGFGGDLSARTAAATAAGGNGPEEEPGPIGGDSTLQLRAFAAPSDWLSVFASSRRSIDGKGKHRVGGRLRFPDQSLGVIFENPLSYDRAVVESWMIITPSSIPNFKAAATGAIAAKSLLSSPLSLAVPPLSSFSSLQVACSLGVDDGGAGSLPLGPSSRPPLTLTLLHDVLLGCTRVTVAKELTLDRLVTNPFESRAGAIRNTLRWEAGICVPTAVGIKGGDGGGGGAGTQITRTDVFGSAFWQLNRNVGLKATLKEEKLEGAWIWKSWAPKFVVSIIYSSPSLPSLLNNKIGESGAGSLGVYFEVDSSVSGPTEDSLYARRSVSAKEPETRKEYIPPEGGSSPFRHPVGSDSGSDVRDAKLPEF